MLGEWTFFLLSEDLENIMPSFNRRGAIGMTLFCFLFITGALLEVSRVSAELDAAGRRLPRSAVVATPAAAVGAAATARNGSRAARSSILAAVPGDRADSAERSRRGSYHDPLEPEDVVVHTEEYVDRPPLPRRQRRTPSARPARRRK